MIHHVTRRSFGAPAVFAALALCAASAFGQGFTGQFAPSQWTTGSNSPGVNLVAIDSMSATLSNYAPWAVSGAAMTFPGTSTAGTVTFTYVTSGVTNACPAAYFVGGTPTLLNPQGTTVSFSVPANTPFGFALNGQSLPNNFGCSSDGSQISFTVAGLSFMPASGAAGTVNFTFKANRFKASINVNPVPGKYQYQGGKKTYSGYAITGGTLTDSNGLVLAFIPHRGGSTAGSQILWADGSGVPEGSSCGINPSGPYLGGGGPSMSWWGGKVFGYSNGVASQVVDTLVSCTDWPIK